MPKAREWLSSWSVRRPLALVSTAVVVFVVAVGGGRVAEGTESAVDSAVAAGKHAAKGAALPDASLAVPEGNALGFRLAATGVQIYVCQVAGAPGTATWVFKSPEATLFESRQPDKLASNVANKLASKVAGKHFAGPTWEAKDGSQVVGAKVSAFAPDASAVPWLLLKAASHQGAGRMAKVTFIQRLDTVGGIAPTTGCDATHNGETTRVSYTAIYAFHVAKS